VCGCQNYTRSIAYDKIDQVKTVRGSNSETYSYDANGNRTNTGYGTGVDNQLLTDGVYNYSLPAQRVWKGYNY
jgi:hypothetical protein